MNWLARLVVVGDALAPFVQRGAKWLRRRKEKPKHMPRPTRARDALRGYRVGDDSD